LQVALRTKVSSSAYSLMDRFDSLSFVGASQRIFVIITDFIFNYLEDIEPTAILALRVYAELCRVNRATAIIGAKQLYVER